MLAFALSIDDFVISNFNSGTTVTFPLYIFGAAQRGIPVEVNVIAMILFFATVSAMGFVTWQQRRAEKMASVRPDQEEIVVVPGLAADVEADQLGDLRHRGRKLSRGLTGHLGLLLGLDAEADRFAADPVEGLGGPWVSRRR